jgi:2-oxoglutarate dehydrogenase E1 component
MTQDFGVNQGLVEELYLKYRENPSAVSEAWQRYFDSLDVDIVPARHSSAGTLTSPGRLTSPGTVQAPSPSPAPGPITSNGVVTVSGLAAPALPSIPLGHHRQSFAPGPETRTATELQARVSAMVNAYRVRGHLFADLDPLGMLPKPPFDISPEAFGLAEVDGDTVFNAMAQSLPLKEIIARLSETYCRSIGVEVTQIEDPEERDWLQTRMESTRNRPAFTREAQLAILGKLTEAEVWETFLHAAYKGAKRFSLEGGDATVPLCDILVETATGLGVEEVVIGMAHRGRLNVLVNVMELPARDLLAVFEDTDPERMKGRGDVKYHLGYSTDRSFDGKKVHLTLSFNPSHLEFVNPVVEGRVRAKQDRRGDHERKRVLPLLIHGDAAFIGQGVVAETINLAYLKGYTTGGTIHVVINNQLGYTTPVEDARSTRYCTDLIRMLRCPVFHVNGDDAQAVAHVARLAAEYRQKYAKDVCIDLYCYRKYGHNEGDEPRFTQPEMYARIDAKESPRKIYAKELTNAARVTEHEVEALLADRRQRLADALDEVRRTKRRYDVSAGTGVWTGFMGGPDAEVPEVSTGVDAETLKHLARSLGTYPDGFTPMRQLQVRADEYRAAADGKPMRWGIAENLAYASLLVEGHPVRFSGQDSQRGTFGHRHAVVHEIGTGRKYTPLEHVGEALGRPQAGLAIYDSALSEQGVLGYEWGYSLDCPEGLVVWEAQFGDFANGAQVIIDQFITSSEDKWHRLSGLVMLLPHGFEGGGPEHSSARLERFLCLAAEDNIQVVNLTTSAQIFHALRRQLKRAWRKPLVVMSPKSLFRDDAASTTIDELATGSFQRIIPDREVVGKKAKRVICCSGKLYHELAAKRKADGREDVAIVRFEQLYPLRADEIQSVFSAYADGTDVVWAQEEPWNSGAWYFMNARLPAILEGRFPLRCVSRVESASPATGSMGAHKIEQAQLIDEAFSPTRTGRTSSRPRASA